MPGWPLKWKPQTRTKQHHRSIFRVEKKYGRVINRLARSWLMLTTARCRIQCCFRIASPIATCTTWRHVGTPLLLHIVTHCCFLGLMLNRISANVVAMHNIWEEIGDITYGLVPDEDVVDDALQTIGHEANHVDLRLESVRPTKQRNTYTLADFSPVSVRTVVYLYNNSRWYRAIAMLDFDEKCVPFII